MSGLLKNGSVNSALIGERLSSFAKIKDAALNRRLLMMYGDW